MPIDITSWGIRINNSAFQNTRAFLQNFKNISDGTALHLPSGTYKFNMIYFEGKDEIELYGDVGNGKLTTVIKFESLPGRQKYLNKKWKGMHSFLKIAHADGFYIHNIAFDGRNADKEGGITADDGATNGIIKSVNIYDPYGLGITIGGNDYHPQSKTYNITVEDCEVYGQRHWSGDAKASFLAGGGADNITFKNCTAHRSGFYSGTPDSPADLFDTDNATNVKYIHCTAVGTNNKNIRKGVGFWNEGDKEASSEYWSCKAIKTGGGLAVSEKSTAIAYNFRFDHCSWGGWAAWSHGTSVNLKVYNSTFDGCYSHFPHYRGGGIVIEGAATIYNCEFVHTPDGYNITLFTPDATNNKTVKIESNTFDRSIRGYNVSEGKGDVYIRYNDFVPGTEITQGGNYNWHVSENTWEAEQE